MTTIKLDAKIGGNPAAALEPVTRYLYDNPKARIVGVVELAHVERVEPAPDTDRERSVKIRLSQLEIAGKDEAEPLREVMRHLFLVRTATGTLDEHGQLQLSKGTIERTVGELTEIELARMIAGVRIQAENARRASTNVTTSPAELRKQIQAVANALTNLLLPSFDETVR